MAAIHNPNKPLPRGWQWMRLGEIGRFDSGGTPAKGTVDYWHGDIPFVTGADITDLYISSKHARAFLTEEGLRSGKTGVCYPETILLVTRTRVGRVGVASELMAASQDISLLACGTDCFPEFVVRYLSSISDYLAANCRGAIIQGLTRDFINNLYVPLPSLSEQKRIAAILNEQMKAVEKARAAAEAQLEAAKALQFSYVQETLSRGLRTSVRLNECLIEVTEGIGDNWEKYTVLGATRKGLSLAKEPPGKRPARYKYVGEGSIFYNPMRILLGSIAYVDLNDNEGITSPDYVVFKTKAGVLHHRWFYHWLRSPLGDKLIRSLARGAVRERMLFKRLSKGLVDLPSWEAQTVSAEKIRIVKPLIEKIEAQLHEINALPAALLRRAFNGDL